MTKIIYMTIRVAQDMTENEIEDMQVEIEERLNSDFNRRNDCYGAHTIEVEATGDVMEHQRDVNRLLQSQS